MDVSSNKLVIGHRNAGGWVIDKQAAFPGSVRSDTWYDLLLSVNGVTVTLLVNGGSSFSHTFAPAIIDGFSYGLNWGLVGFGSNNSRGEIDDIAVQVVPPAATVTKTAEFTSAAGPLFVTAPTGTWAASAGRYGVAALTPADTAISLMNLGSVSQLATTSLLDFSTVLKAAGRAGFVFDRYSDTDFKFAAIDVVTKQVVIGHRTASGWTVDAAVTHAALNATTDYTLGVTVRGSSVSVILNSQATGGSLAAVGFVFNGIAVDGRFGLFTRGATASFDSVSVKTNDAAVPATQMAGSPVEASTIETAASATLDARAAQSLLAEALRRWSLVEDASIMATLGRVELIVEDLAGDELAVYRDGRIAVDIDAAGHGWFVDPTPRDDSEFHGTGPVLAANANGAAAGRVDLLSVLSHELGHAIGFGHSAGSVMDENRLPGERATPERWLAALTSAHAPVVETSTGTMFATAPAAAARPAVSIDWSGPSAASAAAAMPARASGDPLRNSTWQQRFVNHLAATPERLHPNAGMRVHLPIAAPLTHV